MDISILTCLYARDNPQYFIEYLDCVKANRDFLSKVILVIDGPIPSKLNDILLSLHPDTLFTISYLPKNVGFVRALNFGLSLCETQYCARLDPDDRMAPNRISRVLEAFEMHDADFVFNGVNIIDRFGKIIKSDSPALEKMKFRNTVYHSGAAFRVDCVNRLLGYRDIKGFEDYDLWLRALGAKMNCLVISEPLSEFRHTEDTLSRRCGTAYVKMEWLALTTMYKDGNITLRHLPFWCLRLASRVLPKSIFAALRRLYM